MTFGAEVEGEILDHFMRGIVCPVYDSGYLGLLESYPGEVLLPGSQPGYSWVPVAAADWGLASGSILCNVNEIAFPIATGDWSVPVGGWVYAASTIFRPEIAAGVTNISWYIKEGERVVFPPGSLCIRQNGREPTIYGHFTDYAENKILNHIFGKDHYPAQTVWMGLLNHDPGEEGSYIQNEVQSWGGTEIGRASCRERV